MFGMNYEIETVILKNDGQMICEIFAPPLKDRSCNSRKAIEYYGTYRISESRTMTAEEFSKQTKSVGPFHIIMYLSAHFDLFQKQVQEAIASKIVDIGPGGTLLYLHMKARSARRKAGKKKIDKRWPTDTAEQRRHLHRLGDDVGDKDIIRDLTNGNEVSCTAMVTLKADIYICILRRYQFCSWNVSSTIRISLQAFLLAFLRVMIDGTIRHEVRYSRW